MKHVFTLLLGALLLAHSAYAQTTDPVRQKLDQIFANLNKSQVPTGRLAEAAVPLAPLQNFDGWNLSDSSRADMDGFRHLYATAQSSRVAGADTLPSLSTFNRRVLAAAPTTSSGAIPIAVQYIGYASLREDAETAGLVRFQNEQLFDVAGRSESPYQTAVLFAAAPERTYSATPTVSLVLRRNLYLATGTLLTTSPTLSIDFGDGQGYRAATWNQPLSTTYATSGTKRVKIQLSYPYYSGRLRIPVADDVRESWFDLTVFAQAPAVANRGGATTANYPVDTPPGSAEGFNQIFRPTYSPPFRADYTDHLGATVNVRYGTGHTGIVKPFIVVEGYNTAKIAPHLVGINNQNNTIVDFIREINRTAPFNFNDALQTAGYDLVYIDFTVGTDDIRRNAALFEEVIHWVNDQKRLAGSAEQNVVMGESMGGLVARYGLARMVRNGYDPQTRLLVLHDSPQRGANNPMGLQALTRQANFPLAILPTTNGGSGTIYTSDMSDVLKEGLAVLDAPATKQLSIKSVTGINNEYDDNSFIDGPYKAMIDFAPTGGPPAAFPTIVATSDGSQCGRPQNTPVYQELTRDNRDWLFGPAGFFRLGIQSEGIANALPAYGTQNTIAHLRIWFTLRVLWAKYDITLLNRNYTSPANTLPLETLPGGTTNLNDQQDLTTNHDNGFLGLWRLAGHTTLYNGDICFVPSYSALDVPSVTPATAYAKYINNTTDSPSPPRVARYIAQENVNGSGTQFNQAHIRFTARNSEWIYDEMQGLPYASSYCATECAAPFAITSSIGSQRLCQGASATFSLPNLPAGTVVTWSATPTSLFTTTAGSGATFTTSAAAGAQGTGTVTATVGPCNTPVSVSVPVGPGEPTGSYFSGAYIGGAGTPLQTVNPAYPDKVSIVLNDPYNFTFTANPSSVSVFVISGNSASFYMPSDAGVTITATATNTGSGCDVTGSFAFTPRPYSYYFAYAPNPASTELTVTAVDAAGQPAPAEPFDADLYDSFGKKVKTKKSDQGKAVLDVRDLPNGLYNLRAGKGKEAISEHVQITH